MCQVKTTEFISFQLCLLLNVYITNLTFLLILFLLIVDTLKVQCCSSFSFYRFPRLWEVLPADVKDTVIYGLSLFINSPKKHSLVPGLGDARTQLNV